MNEASEACEREGPRERHYDRTSLSAVSETSEKNRRHIEHGAYVSDKINTISHCSVLRV